VDLIEKLAKAGKHILLEKPVARTTSEAARVVEICERAGVTLGIVFQHRMRAPSKTAAQRVASGELGKMGYVEIAAPLWRDQSYYDELGRGTYARDGGGVLITQAIHTIDLALSLTGPVTTVQAMTATTLLHQMEAEDLAVAGLRFASGAVGSLVASTASFPQGKETITLHFERGSLRLSADALHLSWRDGRRDEETLEMGSAGEDGPNVDNHEWHQLIIEDFVDAVCAGRAPMVTGREALASHRLIEAIEHSSRKGCRVDITP
jgi:predicted dehydrogenase